MESNYFNDYEYNRICSIVDKISTPFDTLKKYMNHDSEVIRYRVAIHPNINASTLDEMKDDESTDVICGIAQNNNVLNSTLKHIIHKCNYKNNNPYLYSIWNQNIRLDDLNYLYDTYKKSESIERAIVDSDLCDGSLLMKCVTSSYAWTRYSILKHKNVTKELIEKLSQDVNITISSEARVLLESFQN